MQITLIVNARDPDRVEELRHLVNELRWKGHEVRPHLTFEAGDAARMAREAGEAGAELVVAAGGDGTLNEVVNGLLDDGGAGRLPRVAILPLGTANDLAHALEIPMELPDALRVAVEGNPREVDVGVVDGRCFLNVSSGGIGAEATEETSSDAKRALGAFSYVVTGVRKFAALEASHARFSGEETIYEGGFLLFAVGNSSRTGGGNLLTPRADMTDGLLDLCIVKEMSRMEFLRLMPELRAGTHLDHPGVIYRQVTRVRVESGMELSVNADGEPLEGKLFEYSLAPRRVELMVP